jgi:uncharacterized repeat protein (TIGR01451 family)
MRRRPPRPLSARSIRPSVELMEKRALLATFVVTNTNDDTNMGSLRWAITQSNATTGPNVIDFHIASSGVRTIAPTSALPTITMPVTIDGTTEPGYAGMPLIELDGAKAGGGVEGLNLTAGHSTVEGLSINRFGDQGILVIEAGYDLITKNFLGTDPTGTIAEGNGNDGVQVREGAGHVTISGNLCSGNDDSGFEFNSYNGGNPTPDDLAVDNLVGTDVTGTKSLSNGDRAIILANAPGATVGGTTAAARNVFVGYPLEVQGGADGSVIEGNYIGTDLTGEVALGITGSDINFTGNTSNITIGGTAAGAGNVISAGMADGIYANGGGTGILIEGNLIGTDATGLKPLGNGGDGVYASGNNASIGGLGAGQANVIANNGAAGSGSVGVRVTSQDVPILSNSIYANQAGGIVLVAGANNSQAAPKLLSAQSEGGTSMISGSLASPNGTYTLQFFASPTLDSNGNAEGQTLLGTETLTVTGGSTPFNDTLSTSFASSDYVTATATDSAGNTSQFSVGLQETNPIPTLAVSASAASVPAGQTVTDTFTITNPDPKNTDAGIVFTDPIPANVAYVSGMTSTGVSVTLAGGVATATIGNLASGQSMTVTIVLVPSSAATPSFTNTGQITATSPMIVAGTDTASATTTVTQSDYVPPTLSASGSASTVPAGVIVTDTFTISNPDIAADIGVVFTDPIPSGVTFVSGTFSGGGMVTLANGVATATIGNLAPGQSVTVMISLLTSVKAIPSFTNTGQITATSPVIAAGSITASVATNVTQAADLVAAVSVQSPLTTGLITFTASVYNIGPIAAQDVSLADTFTLPAGAKIVSESVQQGGVLASGNVVTATIDTVPVGSTVDLTVIVATSAGGAYTQSFVVSSSTPDPALSNNAATLTSTILGQDSISLTPSANIVAPGKPLTLNAQVSVPTGFPVATTSVTFLDGSTPIGTAMLDASGHASLVISNLAKGPHSISVSYAGDPNYPAVNSTATAVRVGKSVAGDFDGDGKADLAVYDPTTAQFVILYSAGGSRIQPFGNPKDYNIPVSGDFDGDGKADLAIYDQTTSTFYVLESGGGTIIRQFGNPKDVNIPASGDFDGDGKSDLGIYDQTASEFIILESGGGSIIRGFGNSKDVNFPVTGDFDGDGKSDVGIYDQTASEFIILESGGGSIIRGFGNSKDVNFPVTGDFDGDGKADVGIYDRTASTFIVLESGGGTITQHLGNAADADIPLAVDLDGDGKADLVIYDSALAEFFADESGGGTLAMPFGSKGHANRPI